jgi:hypothetical protein
VQRTVPPAGNPGPRLSFGRAVLPPTSQPIHVFLPETGGQPQLAGTGRVIRVPVINQRGAGEAKRVHARITFLPDDRDGQFSPRDPAQGEWFGESGPEVEIDIPGNGRPRLLDILVVLDGNYPHAHEWTTASRHAALRAYAIKANPIEVEIEVIAAGGTSSSRGFTTALSSGFTTAKSAPTGPTKLQTRPATGSRGIGLADYGDRDSVFRPCRAVRPSWSGRVCGPWRLRRIGYEEEPIRQQCHHRQRSARPSQRDAVAYVRGRRRPRRLVCQAGRLIAAPSQTTA